MKFYHINLTIIIGLTCFSSAQAQQPQQAVVISDQLEQKVIEWRRDLHQNPELSNREFRTAKVIAEHLNKLGLDCILYISPSTRDS